jgi:hypothetical protein
MTFWSIFSNLLPFTLSFALLFNNTSRSIQTASVVWWVEFLATDPEFRVRFPALPDFLRSSGSGTESTEPREYTWGATWKEKKRLQSRKARLRPQGIRRANCATPLYPLALTSLTSGSRSVDIIRARTTTTELLISGYRRRCLTSL